VARTNEGDGKKYGGKEGRKGTKGIKESREE
jgi:hypothetical protein